MKIISGGQTGVDRAALDVAIEQRMEWGGWCPKGGWAEDLIDPPGVLAKYPHLRETPLPNPLQRTEWNVRDSRLLTPLLGYRHSRRDLVRTWHSALAARERAKHRASMRQQNG